VLRATETGERSKASEGTELPSRSRLCAKPECDAYLVVARRGSEPLGHNGPRAIESAVTATRRHLDRALPINTSNRNKLYERVVASYLKNAHPDKGDER
jgi:hypothetical protein